MSTRRSARVAFPKWVTDNTAKIAVKAKTLNEGRSIEGAHAGFPFPIPKTGYEVMWNHLVRFNGQAYEAKYRNLTVDAGGRTTLATEGVSVQEYPFWDNTKTSAETYWRIKITYTGPARRAGEALMVVDPLDIGTKDRRAWMYLPGQRRVKVAPDLALRHAQPRYRGRHDLRRRLHLQRLDGPLRLQAGGQEGNDRALQRLYGGVRPSRTTCSSPTT